MVSRTVVVENATASPTTLSYVTERDLVIRGLFASDSNVVVSDDPSLTWARVGAPTADGVTDKLRIVPTAQIQNFNVTLPKGYKLYFAFAGKASAILLVDDVE